MTPYNLYHAYEIARASQQIYLAELVKQAETERLLRRARLEVSARKRFFRMYLIRHVLIRLAPRWAARLEL